jgi:RNA polymerase sigma-70 factor, ECF subfamily
VPANLTRHLTQINGEPGIVSYLDGKPFSVVTLDIAGEQVRGIYVLTNPDKLTHLSEPSQI